MEKNGAPLPPENVDDEVRIVFEKRVLSHRRKNDEKGMKNLCIHIQLN